MTAEGTHLGAMAATVDIVTRGFGGVRTEGERVVLGPRQQAALRSVRFTLVYRAQRMRISLDNDAITVAAGPQRSRLIEPLRNSC